MINCFQWQWNGIINIVNIYLWKWHVVLFFQIGKGWKAETPLVWVDWTSKWNRWSNFDWEVNLKLLNSHPCLWPTSLWPHKNALLPIWQAVVKRRMRIVRRGSSILVVVSHTSTSLPPPLLTGRSMVSKKAALCSNKVTCSVLCSRKARNGCQNQTHWTHWTKERIFSVLVRPQHCSSDKEWDLRLSLKF